MSHSRRLDIQRLKNSLRSKSDGGRNKILPTNPAPVPDVAEATNNDPADTIPKQKLTNKKSSPTIRTFNSRNILPIEGSVGHLTPEEDSPSFNTNAPLPAIPRHARSETDIRLHAQRGATESPTRSSNSLRQNFDLAPPPPKMVQKTLDGLAERLFSEEHLGVILRDPTQFSRFTAFLNQYRPQVVPVLVRYLETQKAIKAIEYANAVADTIPQLPSENSSFIPCSAAILDGRFEVRSRRAFDSLMVDALPAWITHSLVQVVTDTMVKEITGNSLPLMRDLVGGLAEVFCLSDPSLKDNPIVYASEEFYRTTQYGSEYSIGRNCRFLQGPKTNRPTISRLKAVIDAGQEICETVLNYRRDGSPFINLLMCAPLYDNRGAVRYYIGAQVDVSGLVIDGKGIESFERLLAEDKLKDEQQRNSNDTSSLHTKNPIKILGELGQMLSIEESYSIQNQSRSNSMRDDSSLGGSSPRATNSHRNGGFRYGRRVLGDEQRSEDNEKQAWALSSSGPAGKLPGVYQNYFLVRPSPSLRIIFVSPALRIPGLTQSHLLSHIGGPSHVRDGLSDAFAGGIPVTAKVNWLPNGRYLDDGYGSDVSSERNYSSIHINGNGSVNGNVNGNGITNGNGNANGNANSNGSAAGRSHQQQQGKIRWLNCTPLLGSDDCVGVWMVVMVEDERVTGTLASRTADRDRRCIDNSGSKATPMRGEWAGHHFQRSTLSSRGVGSGSHGEMEVGNGNGRREEQEGERVMTL